ncbi:MAG: UDP-N-acetylmuramoyl-L-alanyl-D-glutamate--2,6-diaminopimelate ligase [Thermodesulfobacteriota bacterium]
MKIKDIFSTEALGYKASDGEVEIKGVTSDSRCVGEGYLFAALKGEHVDGLEFVGEAVERGAACVLAEAPSPGIKVPEVIVEDAKAALGRVAALFSGEPSARMEIVGITGTNGKTTVAYLLESILKEAGFTPGVIGTISYRYGGTIFPAPLTTPPAPELQELMKDMADSGATHCVMEVSSHALSEKRVEGCGFGVKIFTNLSAEHLDYHHSMEEYFDAKRRLFTDAVFDSGRGEAAHKTVINIDDEWGRRLLKDVAHPLKYGTPEGGEGGKGADIFPEDVSMSGGGIEATVVTPLGRLKVSSRLVGEHNLQNIMAAVGAGCAMELPLEAIEKGVNMLESVPGRLEKVEVKEGVTAFVDYAHTPDALERTLLALREISQGGVVTVFGCGGDRDRSKRALMGEISGRLSALTIITSDNPRGEDPTLILKEVEEGIEKENGGGAPEDGVYTVIEDRAEAIREAVEAAEPGETILVAGKGHENHQIIKGERIPFDDLKALREALKKERCA